MSASKTYAERRKKEAAFHDEWAAGLDPATTLVDETFTAVTALENQHVLQQFGDLRGKRILDYGCGAAEGGVYFAKQGAHVVGIDVSPGMLEAAQKLAAFHGVTIETRCVEGDGIPAQDNEFDLIYGNGVLHHVDLSKTRGELARVLKAQGKGCFIEPLKYNPVIEVYRHIADTVRTDDEHPLSFEDIDSFASCFQHVQHKEFWFSTLAVFFKFFLVDRVHPKQERYWKKVYTDAPAVEPWFRSLKRFDERLLDAVPPLRRFCWNTVITVDGPKK